MSLLSPKKFPPPQNFSTHKSSLGYYLGVRAGGHPLSHLPCLHPCFLLELENWLRYVGWSGGPAVPLWEHCCNSIRRPKLITSPHKIVLKNLIQHTPKLHRSSLINGQALALYRLNIFLQCAEILGTPSNVKFLEFIKSDKNTSSRNSPQYVCPSSFHQRHRSFLFDNLN